MHVTWNTAPKQHSENMCPKKRYWPTPTHKPVQQLFVVDNSRFSTKIMTNSDLWSMICIFFTPIALLHTSPHTEHHFAGHGGRARVWPGILWFPHLQSNKQNPSGDGSKPAQTKATKSSFWRFFGCTQVGTIGYSLILAIWDSSVYHKHGRNREVRISPLC